MAKKTKSERATEIEQAREMLMGVLKPGMRLYFVQTAHSPSGTCRYRVLIAHTWEGDALPSVIDITYNVGLVTDHWSERARELSVPGCGYHKPQHVTGILARKLGGAYVEKDGLRYDR